MLLKKLIYCFIDEILRIFLNKNVKSEFKLIKTYNYYYCRYTPHTYVVNITKIKT